MVEESGVGVVSGGCINRFLASFLAHMPSSLLDLVFCARFDLSVSQIYFLGHMAEVSLTAYVGLRLAVCTMLKGHTALRLDKPPNVHRSTKITSLYLAQQYYEK